MFASHVLLSAQLDGVWCSFEGSWYVLFLLVLTIRILGDTLSGWVTQGSQGAWVQLGFAVKVVVLCC